MVRDKEDTIKSNVEKNKEGIINISGENTVKRMVIINLD
jgi:hypothetical protein